MNGDQNLTLPLRVCTNARSWTRMREFGIARRPSSNLLQASNEGPGWKTQRPTSAIKTNLNSTCTSFRQVLSTLSMMSAQFCMTSGNLSLKLKATRVKDDNRESDLIEVFNRSDRVIRPSQTEECMHCSPKYSGSIGHIPSSRLSGIVPP